MIEMYGNEAEVLETSVKVSTVIISFDKPIVSQAMLKLVLTESNSTVATQTDVIS